MDFLKTISVAASGLKAQSGRMRVIAENIANADSTGARPGADPYRRKVPTFQRRFDRELEASVVDLGRVRPTPPRSRPASSPATRRRTRGAR
jgi:flagellar basal-body rod protein FlgC